MAHALTARIAKSGRPVREYIEADKADIPPGAAFETRHELRAYAKRKPFAAPLWAREAP